MRIIEDAKETNVKLKVCLDGVNALIDELRKENIWIRKQYRSGIRSFEEACNQLFRIDVMSGAISAAGWSLGPNKPSQFVCATRGQYEALMADYHAWRSGLLCETTPGIPWLYVWAGAKNTSAGFFLEDWCRGPASQSDKDLFFELLDAAFIPVEFFAVPPDGMPTPTVDYKPERQQSGGFQGSFLTCHMDIAPLLRSDNPIGVHFDLPLIDGGIAHMDIVDVDLGWVGPYSSEPDPTSFNWEAKGWIEGYTSQMPRRLEFKNHYTSVKMILMPYDSEAVGAEDRKAFNESPIWKPFWDWFGRKHEVVENAKESSFRAFLEGKDCN